MWVAEIFYLWWIWDHHYSCIQGHTVRLSEHALFCLCASQCVSLCVYLYVRAKIEAVRKEQRDYTCSILLSGFSSSGFRKISSLSKPYSPSLPETHNIVMTDSVIIYMKLLTMLHCRLQHNHTSSDDFRDATHILRARTHEEQRAHCTSLLRLISISSGFASLFWLISSLFHSYGAIQCLQTLLVLFQKHLLSPYLCFKEWSHS